MFEKSTKDSSSSKNVIQFLNVKTYMHKFVCKKRETVLKSKQSKIEIGVETGRKEGKDGSNMRGGKILILMGL